MLKRGEVVKNRWRIEQRLGKGTFCELHRASDLSKNTSGAAVKVEVQGMQRSVLRVGSFLEYVLLFRWEIGLCITDERSRLVFTRKPREWCHLGIYYLILVYWWMVYFLTLELILIVLDLN